MTKTRFLSLGIIASFILSSSIALADVQSPIYTDDIGRSHFLGRGGYSNIRHTQIEEAQTNIINKSANEISKSQQEIQNAVNKTEKDITDVINEKSVVPTASKNKITVTTEQRKLDASAPFGQGMTNIPAGVNKSKTMYTDDLGRLHFFGKGNIIKD